MLEREHKQEGKKKSQADSALGKEPDERARPHDPEIMTWAKAKNQMLNNLCHIAVRY